MESDLHGGTQKAVAFVLFVMFAAIAFIFTWAFWINKGSLVLSSRVPFQVTISGELYNCDTGECRISLSPGVHQVLAEREGYFIIDEQYYVERWNDVEAELRFRYVPQLNEAPVALESVDDDYTLRKQGDEWMLRDGEGEMVTSFVSLDDPQLSWGEGIAAVVDEGAITLVRTESGRKQQLFGNDIQITQAQVHPSGSRVLLFGQLNDNPYLWVWDVKSSSFETLSWYESEDRVAWNPLYDSRILLLSDRVQFSIENDLISLFTNAVDQIQKSRLMMYHLDTESAEVLNLFPGESPLNLTRHVEKLYLEYPEQKFYQLMFEE